MTLVIDGRMKIVLCNLCGSRGTFIRRELGSYVGQFDGRNITQLCLQIENLRDTVAAIATDDTSLRNLFEDLLVKIGGIGVRTGCSPVRNHFVGSEVLKHNDRILNRVQDARRII